MCAIVPPLRQQSVCVLPAMQPTAYTGREYVSMGVRVRLRTEVDVYSSMGVQVRIHSLPKNKVESQTVKYYPQPTRDRQRATQ